MQTMQYNYSHREEGGGEKVEGQQTVNKAGSKIPTWLTVPSVYNSDKHPAAKAFYRSNFLDDDILLWCLYSWLVQSRVSSKWKKKFGSNRNKPKQDLFRVCFGLFRETKKKFPVCFGVSNLYRNNRNKQNCFETNRNNPELSEKKPI